MKKIYLVRFLDRTGEIWEIDAAALTLDEAKEYCDLLRLQHPRIATNILPVPLHEKQGD